MTLEKTKMKYQLNYYKILGYSLIPINIFLILLLELDFFGKLPVYWNSLWVFYIFLIVNTWFLALRLKHIPDEKKREDDYTVFLSGYFFLLGLVIIAINQFIKRQIVIDYMPHIIGVVIALGFLTFFASRERVEKEIENEKTKEELAGEKRKGEFATRFPFINKIPILRNIVKWMYGEGFVYILILIFILCFFSVVYMYRLGDQYLWTDEVFSFHAAKMILEKGVPVYNESGLNYTRSIIYHYSLALSMLIFGANEFGSRVINIIFIMAMVILIYYIFRKKSKNFGLISGLILLTINFELSMVRETRMYTMFSFMFIMSIFSFYNAIINREKFRHKIIIYKNIFQFNLYWLLIFFLFFFLSFETNQISVLLLLGLPIYYIIACIRFKFRKNDVLLCVLLILFIFSITLYQFKTLNLWTAYTQKTTLDWAVNNQINTHFYTDLLKNNLSFYIMGLILLTILLILLKDKFVLLLSSVFLISLYIISYQRQLQERYIYFLIPISVILITISYYYFIKIFKNDKILKLVFMIIILLLLASQIFLFYKEINEINKYTDKSISQHKKFEFNKIFNYLNNLKNNDSLLIADWHSTFTLIEKGYSINYILINSNDIYLTYGKNDPYFKIPYILYESKDFNDLIKNNKITLVIRDYRTFNNIQKYSEYLNIADKPRIYLINNTL